MRHGTIDAYTNHQCRCDSCRVEWNRYNRASAAKRVAAGICTHCSAPRDPQSMRLCRRHIEQSRVRSNAHYRRMNPKPVAA